MMLRAGDHGNSPQRYHKPVLMFVCVCVLLSFYFMDTGAERGFAFVNWRAKSRLENIVGIDISSPLMRHCFFRQQAIVDYQPQAAVCAVFLTISHWAISAALLYILTLALSRSHCFGMHHILPERCLAVYREREGERERKKKKRK